MNCLIETYGDDLLMVFHRSKLKDQNYDYLAVIKSKAVKKELKNILVMNYDEDFESLLAYKIPPKTRKQAKLLSYPRVLEMLERVSFAAIGCVIDDMPYTYSMNYVMVDGHMYFHTGRRGYKLAALDTKASVNVVEDLGIAKNGSHNFRSVQIYGTLKATEDYETKKKVFMKYISHINQNHVPYADTMQNPTLVFEVEFDYVMGRENLFIPNDK